MFFERLTEKMSDPVSLANAFAYGTADKRIEVLRKIGETGSISQAAREAGISYKAAWQAIDTLTNLTGVSLVEKIVGGIGGGGAKLTDEGLQLLRIAGALEKKRQEVLDEFREEKIDAIDARFSRLSIRTSMRNYLPCRVKGLKMSGQIVRVCLEVHESMAVLVARITRTSAELLALKPGLAVVAMCKATAVRVSGEARSSGLSTANQFQGTVSRISKGEKEDEITIELFPGLQLVGFASAGEEIETGGQIQASVDESAVVVALLP